MNRREFCRRLAVIGGSAALSPLLNACAPDRVRLAEDARTAPTLAVPPAATDPPPPATRTPTGTPAPAETTMPSAQPTPAHAAGAVALVKTTDRADGVRRALELLGVPSMSGERVLLKPNFNSADPAPGSTHTDVLRALVEELANASARSITVGDRSGMGDTRAVMQRKGVFALAEEFGLDTVVFDELPEEEWVLQQDAGFYWSQGFAVPRILLDADRVVQTCNLKTHRYGGHFTLSLKNSVGLAAETVAGRGHNYMTELHNSPYQRHMIAEVNTAYQPALIVMDGVEAFVEGGPATGKKVAANVVLAATDRVALDAVGVALLRMFGTTPEVSTGRVFEQTQIARAVELGLGVTSPEEIAFLTGDPDSAAYAADIQRVLLA